MAIFFFLLALVVVPMAHASDGGQWAEPRTGMQFLRVSGGCFRMGAQGVFPTSGSHVWSHLSYETDIAGDEKPAHEACVSEFWMGVQEVTAEQWENVVGMPPRYGQGKQPASGMTWREANEFALQLSQRSPDGSRYRLPTEAEWEYACRAGETKSHKDELSALRGFRPTKDSAPGTAENQQANRWGFKGMVGSVWEWGQEDYLASAYRKHRLHDPSVMEPLATEKVIRGGSFMSDAVHLRCASRGAYLTNDGLPQIGLRLVRFPGKAAR